MNTRLSKRTMNLVLAGVMIALGTVLNFIKFLDMPYGGSITLCSMLPIMIYAYKCGTKWGLGAGLTFSVLQLLFGLDALKGISGGVVVGSILLDYILAFTVLGLAGIFRGRIQNDTAAFALGAFVSGMLRYLCSFLSGWILWGEYADVAKFPMLATLPGISMLSKTVQSKNAQSPIFVMPSSITTFFTLSFFWAAGLPSIP